MPLTPIYNKYVYQKNNLHEYILEEKASIGPYC
jgi:hypothetical protein